MKLLLTQKAIYNTTLGGAPKANRILIEGLAARGHDCRVVAPAAAQTISAAELRAQLEREGLNVIAASAEAVVYRHADVEIHAIADITVLRAYLRRQIETFAPDWTLASTEDPAQVLLEVALEASGGRVVLIAHTTLHLPFGPTCFVASATKTQLIRRTAGIITVSSYVKDYIQRWSGCDSQVIPFPVYGSPPFPRFGTSDRGYVTLINPCAVKGLSIFTALAERLPEVAFAAVPTWGTTDADRAMLERLPNVRLLRPVAEIDELFAQTRVLLAPSLWDEAFGQVAVEAMLRGIPVLASDAGGLPEAKLGVPYVLPVRPIERYEERLDNNNIPVAIVPQQDVDPWLSALQRLLGDREHYQAIADASCEAAHAYLERLDIAPFDTFLRNLKLSDPANTSTAQPQPQTVTAISGLSPEQRALLALRLRQRNSQPAPQPISRPAMDESETTTFPLSSAQRRIWFLEQL
ncbi:MAG TPA: glycosyltransferase, partial [Herpetosiphonaceae bacterium]